jgi:hypothetical protein
VISRIVTGRCTGRVDNFPVRIHACVDMQIGKFRSVFVQPIIGLKLACLVQGHQGNAGDRLDYGTLMPALPFERAQSRAGARSGSLSATVMQSSTSRGRHRHRRLKVELDLASRRAAALQSRSL